MFILSVDNIKQFKGAPLAVLFLLFFCPEPVSQAWLERWSGYSDKTILQACHFLKEKGLIHSTLDGWVLGEAIFLPQHPRRNSGSIISINDSDLKELKDLKPESTNNTEPRNFSGLQNADDPQPDAVLAPEAPEKREMWQILSEAGIHRNDRTRALLKLPHINPADLRAKVEDYKASDPSNPGRLGLLILALEAGEAPAPRAENGHLLTCECSKCAVRRFYTRH